MNKEILKITPSLRSNRSKPRSPSVRRSNRSKPRSPSVYLSCRSKPKSPSVCLSNRSKPRSPSIRLSCRSKSRSSVERYYPKLPVSFLKEIYNELVSYKHDGAKERRERFLRKLRKALGIKVAEWRIDQNYMIYDFNKVVAYGDLYLLEDRNEQRCHGRLVGPDPTYADLWVAADKIMINKIMINNDTAENRFIEDFTQGGHVYVDTPVFELSINKRFSKNTLLNSDNLRKEFNENKNLTDYFGEWLYKECGNPVIVTYKKKRAVVYCRSADGLVDILEKEIPHAFDLKQISVISALPSLYFWTDCRYDDTDDEKKSK